MKSMVLLGCIVWCCFVPVLCGGVFADDSVQKSDGALIEVGQSVDDTKAIFQDRGIEWGRGGLAMTGSRDSEKSYFRIDNDGPGVAVFFSKSKQVVTGIWLQYYPPGRASKLNEVTLDAKSIRLNDDGSYVVHFLAPVKRQVVKKKSVYPSSKTP